MPTTKEIEDAQQQIHDVLDGRYVQGPYGVSQVHQGTDAPKDAVGFTDLNQKDRFSFLATNASWEGFSTDQSLDVIDRVMEGSHPEQWMDGIVASDHQAVYDEVRADEHADRVRDFGEADAAGYADRMAESYAVQADALGPERPPGQPITPEELDEMERGWPPFEQRLAEAGRIPQRSEDKGRER